MRRRTFCLVLGSLATAALWPGVGVCRSGLLASPVTTNRLRPPGAVEEDLFVGRCIRCGRCVESCPYRCIELLDIRHGLHAGTPLISVEQVPCYLCMKCVRVCPTGSLRPIAQEATRMGTAVVDTFACVAWTEVALCRTCYDVCPFKGGAIVLNELKPKVVAEACTGCGLCTHGCPITTDKGLKAINCTPHV